MHSPPRWCIKIKPVKHELGGRDRHYVVACALLIMTLLTYKKRPELVAIIFKVIQKVGRPNEFCDHWWRALPVDDLALADSVIRIQFTEIWIDLNEVQELLVILEDLFNRDLLAAGNFGVEIYPASQSPFWLSMSYGRDVVRINVHWWEYNVIGDIDSYFEKFCSALLPRFKSARLHWGKHWPAVGKKYGDQDWTGLCSQRLSQVQGVEEITRSI
jgi:hypothetical protein